jgi:hypothetical protein
MAPMLVGAGYEPVGIDAAFYRRFAFGAEGPSLGLAEAITGRVGEETDSPR